MPSSPRANFHGTPRSQARQAQIDRPQSSMKNVFLGGLGPLAGLAAFSTNSMITASFSSSQLENFQDQIDTVPL
ncbi:hypothetical protein RCIA154 [Methanocella arvoryzae MRE50]|uniref:Uncharacterized protein n=1 Tax=Methanocella arvoryzae (strain DSM 22066 / NBRC 105507 / MRE50) TaxID=351160 RepID=Q0W326_METAR|nr:hypothetical protein RCIA154 [Methanocella arvoryzae MRE50]